MQVIKKLLVVTLLIIVAPIVAQAKIGDITMSGKIKQADGKEVVITREAISQMKRSQIITTTAWTKQGHSVVFEGIRVKDLLDSVGAYGNILRVYALNDYWVDIPVSDVDEFDIILADSMDGKKLEVRNFGPYFIIYPLEQHERLINNPQYLSRFTWQVDKIKVL